MKKIMKDSIVVYVSIGSYEFKNMFTRDAEYKSESIEIVQFEEISKEYLIAEVSFTTKEEK